VQAGRLLLLLLLSL
jgi:hypothetical protein